jgi:hypothetical protein
MQSSFTKFGLEEFHAVVRVGFTMASGCVLECAGGGEGVRTTTAPTMMLVMGVVGDNDEGCRDGDGHNELENPYTHPLTLLPTTTAHHNLKR